MRPHLILLLYGLCTWGASVNFPAWLRLVVQRLRDPARPYWRGDTILFVRCGLALLSFGIAGLAGVRLFGALFARMPIEIPSPLGLLFIGCMAAAEPLFLVVDEIHCKARGKRSVSWRLYWAVAIGMVVVFGITQATERIG